MSNIALTPSEIKGILKHMIKNNQLLANEGKAPVALEVKGEAGIGKTSVISQTASEENCHFVRLNLSEITLEDLIGYPVKEYRLVKGEASEWVVENAVDYFLEKGYTHTSDHRMSYSKPKWIINKEDKPVVLLLDDYTRGGGTMMQATMTLIDEGGYVSWKLPKGSTVFLSSNPDNGDFLVTSLDDAQKSRFLSINMKFDIDDWAEYAELAKIDTRCVNFILKHPEVVNGTKDVSDKEGELVKANIRLWTKYFDTLKGIGDFDDSANYKMLMDLGGSFPKEHMQLFSLFIKNKLDKLPTVQELLNGKEADVKLSLKKVITPDENGSPTFRADIAGILSKRIVNFCIYNEEYFKGKENEKKTDLIERVCDLLFAWGFFKKDLIQLAARKLIKVDYLKTKLVSNQKFINVYSGK